MKFWVINPGTDKPDTMLTLGCYALGIILVKFLFSEMSFGPVTFGNLDGSVIASILAPTLGAYVARRYTDTINPKKEDNEISK